jgi:hypothetical protein
MLPRPSQYLPLRLQLRDTLHIRQCSVLISWSRDFISRTTLTADYTLEFSVEIFYKVDVARSGFSNTCYEVLVLRTMVLAWRPSILLLPSFGS